jgi:hypothetical protein
MFRFVLGINVYAVLHGLGIALFAGLMLHYLRAGKVDAIHVIGLTALLAFCEFPVSKFLHDVVVADRPFQLGNYFSIDHYFKGGYFGWPAVFLPAAMLYPVLFRCDRLVVYRSVALTMAPVIALQKMSCLAVGCCGGAPTHSSWGMVFKPDSQCPTPGIPVYPVQACDVIAMLLTWAVLISFDRRPQWRPYLFPLLVAGWGLDLFTTGFFRADAAAFLSLRQALAGGAVLCVVLMLAFGRSFWDRFSDRARSALVTC